MANYSTTSYTTKGTPSEVADALVTKINTVDTGKTIRLVSVVPQGNTFVGVVIYDL